MGTHSSGPVATFWAKIGTAFVLRNIFFKERQNFFTCKRKFTHHLLKIVSKKFFHKSPARKENLWEKKVWNINVVHSYVPDHEFWFYLQKEKRHFLHSTKHRIKNATCLATGRATCQVISFAMDFLEKTRRSFIMRKNCWQFIYFCLYFAWEPCILIK